MPTKPEEPSDDPLYTGAAARGVTALSKMAVLLGVDDIAQALADALDPDDLEELSGLLDSAANEKRGEPADEDDGGDSDGA